MKASLPNLLVIAGPTASGKTGLAVKLAKRLDGEVVSADSMQIYQELRIGTARPSEEEMQGVPHHLLGFLPLTESYSVSRYAADARRILADIFKRGKQPILCGGTGLYIDAIVDNLQFSGEEANREVREKLQLRAQIEGNEALLEELRKIDPETAAHLHPNNLGRIIRALELYETSGITMSEQVRRSRSAAPPFRVCYIVLDSRRRDFLYDRINRRVDWMLENGLLEEARQVLSAPTAPTAMQAIGYKELAPYFKGEIPLELAAENLKRSTRRYAKRQLSWFHRRADAHYLYIDDYGTADLLAEAALKIIKGDEDGYIC